MRMASKERVAIRRCIEALEDVAPLLNEVDRELVLSMVASLVEVERQFSQGQEVDLAKLGHRLLMAFEVLHLVHVATEVAVKTLG